MDPSLPVSTSLQPDWMASYRILTAECGLADLSSRSRVELTGKDRVQFLHSFCTNDIKLLQPGGGCEAFLTNHQGKTVGYVYVRVLPTAIVLDAAPGQAKGIMDHLSRFVISDRVDFLDITQLTGEFLIAGQDASRFLSKLNFEPLPAGRYQSQQFSLAGKDISLQRTDYAGETSYFLTTSAADFAEVQKTLQDAGIPPCEPAAVEAARLEAGVPLFGSDITEENLPQEIHRNKQAISFTKGCYLGQETVARIDALGHVNRLLVGVKFSSAEIPTPGTELFAADKPAGKVTSACWSPRLKGPLAFALLRRANAAPGTVLASSIGTAEVISLPVH